MVSIEKEIEEQMKRLRRMQEANSVSPFVGYTAPSHRNTGELGMDIYKSPASMTKGLYGNKSPSMYGEGAMHSKAMYAGLLNTAMSYGKQGKGIGYGSKAGYSSGYTGIPSLGGKGYSSGGKAGYSSGGKGSSSSGSSSGSSGSK